MTPSTPDVDPYSSWDAAYMLGSLVPAERHEFEQHLANCDACRDRLAALSGLPGLLSLVDCDTLDPAAPAALPNRAPYAVFAGKVRRRRTAFVAAAAAAVLVLGGGAAALAVNLLPDATPPTAIASTAPGATSGNAPVELAFTSTGQQDLKAHGQLRPEPWGTQVSWTCNYAAGTTGAGGARYGNTALPRVYELVVVTTSGERVTVATWKAAPGSTVSPVATTTLPVASIQKLLIRDQSSPGTAVPLLQALL